MSVEVRFVYRPDGFGADGEFTICRSDDSEVLRAVGSAALKEARLAADRWKGVDATLAESARQDAIRLERLIDIVLGTTPSPPLRLVPKEESPRGDSAS